MIYRELSEKKYQIDSIDGLRGFAALIVILSHTSNSDMFFLPYLDFSGAGKSGVFLFFLLSSFLLTVPLLNKGRDIFTFKVMSNYWQRRFFRIFPLYSLYLLLAVISTWLISVFFNIKNFGVPFALDWYGFLSHLLLLEGKGLTWSIAVEFKFYFILPVLVFAIVLVSSSGKLITVFFLFILLGLSQVLLPQSLSVQNDIRLLPYMPIFIIGVLLAFLQHSLNKKAGENFEIYKYLGYLGVLGIIAMLPSVASIFAGQLPNDVFHKQFIAYALFWSFILFSAVNVKGVIQSFFSSSILRFYGALSFSIYLFHPIFIGAAKILELNPYLSAWFVLVGSTITAYISFKLFEAPISKFKFKQTVM